MNTFVATHVRRKALLVSAVAAAVLASSLAYGTDDAAAAYKPDTQPDTVVVQGREGRDVVAATLSGAYAVVAGLPATVRVGGAELADVLRIETLGGDDEVTVAPDLATLLTALVDLGGDE